MNDIESIFKKCLSNTASAAEWQQLVEWLKVPENEPAAKELLLSGFYAGFRELPYSGIGKSADSGRGKAADAGVERSAAGIPDSLPSALPELPSEYAPKEMVEAILWADRQKRGLPADGKLKSGATLTSESVEGSGVIAGSSGVTDSKIRKRPGLLMEYPWVRYAAAVLVIALAAFFTYWLNGNGKGLAVAPADQQEDIAPGGNRAVLTLADGTNILLDSVADGSLARQGNTGIVKLDGGKLVYNAEGADEETMYNTIRTPNGGQYQIVLHDGTKVWLNALSSIRFPTHFTNSREVFVTGEAFFEISPDRSKPFQVHTDSNTGGMKIEVLGTSFNVNAYEDEDGIRTTLLEGKVNIHTAQDLRTLLPGQQSVCRSTEKNILIEKANIEQATAWKNGFFYFNNADLKTVMRQLARWYNVEVIYEGDLPARVFKGEIGRDLQLSDVLEILDEMGIHIKRKQHKLFVLS